MLKAILLGILLVIWPSVVFADSDTQDGSGPSQKGATDQEIEAVLKSGLLGQLAPPHPLAFGPGELAQMGAKAKEAYRQLQTELGDPNKEYDLVIQPGHFGRTSGKTGGEGKYVTEQQITAKVVSVLASSLRKRGVSVV